MLQYPAIVFGQTESSTSSEPQLSLESGSTTESGEATAKAAPAEEISLDAAWSEAAQSMMMAGQDASGNQTSVETRTSVGHKSFGVDENSGALQYSYPLTLPKGRGVTSPALSLDYSNQSASDQDIFGYGWSLSIPYIETFNKLGMEHLFSATTSNNYFSSTFSGELVRIGTTSSYRAKVESGDFLDYERSGDTWVVTDKTGVKYYFGQASTSRQDSTATSSNISRWMLSKVEDQNGNYTSYTYIKNQGVIYPASITYTNGTSTQGIYKVSFTLATSTLYFRSYERGFSTLRAYRVSDIKVYVSDVEVRSYALRYGNGLGGSRDLLLGVTERGTEAGVQVAMPEIIFGYEGDLNPTFTSGQYANTFPEPLGEKDLGVRFGDLNGDGLTDVVRYFQYRDAPNTNTVVRRVHINRGDGTWTYNASWSWDDIAVPFTLAEDVTLGDGNFSYNDLGTRLIDVNADGRDDLVVAYNIISTSSYPANFPPEQIAVYINTGNGFAKDTSWTGLEQFSEWNNTVSKVSYMAKAFIDVNADGLPDIASSWFHGAASGSPQANIVTSVRLNTGNGWVTQPGLNFPAALGFSADANGYRSFRDVGTRFVDVNGDGLIDVVRGYKDGTGNNIQIDEMTVYINTGTGWTTVGWPLPINFAIGAGGTGYNLADINGDRLPDIVFSNDSGGYAFYRNTGNSWVSQSYNLPFYLTKNSAIQNTGVALIDFDGDTIVDGWNMAFTDQQATHATGGSAYINNAAISDQLTRIILPRGGALSAKLDGYLDTVSGSYGLVGTSSYNPVVASRLTYSSGFGNDWTIAYQYSKPDFWYASSSLRDRRLAGFGAVTRFDDFATTTTYYHQGNGNATTTEESSDNIAKIGFAYRTEIRDADNDYQQVGIQTYATSSLGDGANFVKMTRQTILDYDGDSDHRDTATEYAYDNSTGEVTSMTEWGRVTASLDGTFSDVSGDKRTTTYTYASSPANDIVALVSTEITKDESNATSSATRFVYDGQAIGSVVDGNLTKREHWVATSSYIDYEWAYNGYGLVTSEKDPRDKTISYTYDAYNLYPATTTNALSQSTRYTYDYSAGAPKTITDANNLTSTLVYDGLDRVIEEKIPDPATGSSTTKVTYAFNDAVGTSSVLTKQYRSSTSTTDTYSYLDGLGREAQRRTTAEGGSQYVTRDFLYGDGGLLYRESLPYFSTSSARTIPTYITPLYSTYTYDPVGRIKEVQTVVGSTVTSRDQWTETVTDALGNVKEYDYDAYGRLTGVKEHNGTSTYETTYVWDTSGNLTKLTDALGNVRNFTYNGLSRRLTMEDLHNPSDNSFGTWQFSYDASGNLLNKVDPKGQSVSYTYDNVNRTLTEDNSGTTGTEARYTYDSCTRGVGKVCTVGNNSATTTYTYNYAGLTASQGRTIATTTYTTQYSFDRLGNQTLLTYPDSSEVRYVYNAGNQIESIDARESAGTWNPVISDFDYGPNGQVTYEEHANGTKTTKTYDPYELYRLRTIVTTASSTYGMGGGGPEHALLEAELASLGLLEPTPALPEETTVANVTEIVDEPLPLTVETTPMPIVEEVVVSTSTAEGEVVLEEVTATSSEVVASTSSETGVVASTTEVVEFGLTDLASTTDISTVVQEETALTTEPLAPLPVELPVAVDLANDRLITNIHEARTWQKFHAERVAGMQASKDVPPEALKAALYAQEQFDTYLLKKGYTDAKNVPVRSRARDVIESAAKKLLEGVVSTLLPEPVYAYLFGSEDFESCSSLPCSFSNTVTWGSVTQSLDATSKVAGTDSVKEVVTGAGEASLESVNYNEDEIWVQFKVFIPSNMTWGPSGYYSALNFEDASNGSIFWLAIEDWGTPRLTMAGDTLSWTDTGITLTEGAVNTIEVRFKKGASTGDVDIWFNNTNANSPTYNGSGTLNTGTDNVDDIRVGMTYAPENGISTTYYDDMVIDTGFIGTITSAPTEPYDPVLQDVTYIYDAVGNIVAMVDKANASSSVTYGYEYDDLYRLTAFGTTTATIASGTPVVSYQTISLQPGSEGKDTFYGNSSLTGPNGDYLYMYAGGSGSNNMYESFIEFDLASLSGFTSIATATLKLFVYPVYESVGAKLQRVTSAWTESGVTASSIPSATDIGMAWAPAENSTWWTVDTTNVVEDWYDGTHPNYGFKIVTQNFGTNTRLFYTSDATTTAFHPILEVTGTTEYTPYALSASSTFTPIETYSYDAIGNIITKSDVGAYEYDGDASSEITAPIYTDAVASGWTDWSWSTTLNPSNASPVANGTYSLRAAYGTAWAGLGYHSSGFNATPYTSLDLKVNVGTSTNTNLYLYFTDAGGTLIQAVDLEDYIPGGFATSTWHTVSIPLTHLDMETYNGATTFTVESSVPATVYYDDIKFVGTSGTSSYANPHAATTIDGVTQTYDQSGNLTTSGNTTYTWNYDNRMTQSAGPGLSTTTYQYDPAGSRVTKTSGGVTTRYPSSLYEVQGSSTTRHIYAGDSLIATVKGGKTYHNHLDHLGSTVAVTNDVAYLNQEFQYNPFGSTRVSQLYGGLNQRNQYIGQDYDSESELSYLQARYYDGGTGRFMSQDPVFWEVGRTRDGVRILKDPQLANSYSYAENNPITQKDPNGRIAPLLVAIGVVFEVYGYANAGVNIYNYSNVLRFTQGYTDAEIDDAGNRVIKDLVSAGTGFLGGSVIEAGMNAADVVYDTSVYVGGVVRNKYSDIKSSTRNPSRQNINQTTTPIAPSAHTNPSTNSSQTYLSAPGSSGSLSKYAVAQGYLNSAQKALNKGDKDSAARYIDKAKKVLNR